MKLAMPSPQLVGVPGSQFGAVRDRVRAEIERIADGSMGRHTADGIEAMIRDGKCQLWLVVDAGEILGVTLTEIVVYPNARELRIWAGVGRGWRRWAHLRETLALFAQSSGCATMQIIAPRKWRHVLTEYRETHAIFERAV